MTILNELDSTCGLSDEELAVRFRQSIRIDNEVRTKKGLPVAGYDDETQKAYLEYPDGRRGYINADDIKRTTLCIDLEAAVKAEELRERMIVDRKDFTFETVLSFSPTNFLQYVM